MIKRIFRSIIFATLAVLLATVMLIMGMMYSYFTSVQFRQLRSETALAAHAVANEGISYFDNLGNTVNCRITWISKDGTVLYDNRSDKVAMENHLAREEVIQALESGYGQSTRYSNTLLEQYIYAAQRLPDGTILRISSSLQSAPRLLMENIWPALTIIGCAVLLSLMLANRLARQIVRQLNELNLDAPLENAAYYEILPLLQRLDSQQEQLREQSREGHVTVSVQDEETAVCLRVSDTGIGIPETDRERIFERFYRVDKSRSKEVGGTGLGLSIVKHACQILMAELTVSSIPGEGTAVEITFPKRKQAAG